MDIEHAVTTGWDVANRAEAQPTLDYFTALLDQHPTDPRLLFEAACAFDWSGLPERAAPLYEQAFAAGLKGDRLRRGLLQYGSTLRNLNRPTEAVVVLQRANTEFPGHDAIRAFLALALLSAGRADEAVADLLDLSLDGVRSADFDRYQWALRHYAAALRRGYWSMSDDDGRDKVS